MKLTLCQWARTYASQIHCVYYCDIFSVEDHLANIFIRKDNSISREDLIWCSNFQLAYLDCPESVCTHIKNHFNKLFSR